MEVSAAEYTFSKTLGANFDWVPTSTFGDSDIEAVTATLKHLILETPTESHKTCVLTQRWQAGARLTADTDMEMACCATYVSD
eukprot:scaffold5955_cov89-Skeletonema_dohrnii-CCMP3373.AAC.6